MSGLRISFQILVSMWRRSKFLAEGIAGIAGGGVGEMERASGSCFMRGASGSGLTRGAALFVCMMLSDTVYEVRVVVLR